MSVHSTVALYTGGTTSQLKRAEQKGRTEAVETDCRAQSGWRCSEFWCHYVGRSKAGLVDHIRQRYSRMVQWRRRCILTVTSYCKSKVHEIGQSAYQRHPEQHIFQRKMSCPTALCHLGSTLPTLPGQLSRQGSKSTTQGKGKPQITLCMVTHACEACVDNPARRVTVSVDVTMCVAYVHHLRPSP